MIIRNRRDAKKFVNALREGKVGGTTFYDDLVFNFQKPGLSTKPRKVEAEIGYCRNENVTWAKPGQFWIRPYNELRSAQKSEAEVEEFVWENRKALNMALVKRSWWKVPLPLRLLPYITGLVIMYKYGYVLWSGNPLLRLIVAISVVIVFTLLIGKMSEEF